MTVEIHSVPEGDGVRECIFPWPQEGVRRSGKKKKILRRRRKRWGKKRKMYCAIAEPATVLTLLTFSEKRMNPHQRSAENWTHAHLDAVHVVGGWTVQRTSVHGTLTLGVLCCHPEGW